MFSRLVVFFGLLARWLDFFVRPGSDAVLHMSRIELKFWANLNYIVVRIV